MMCIAFCKRKRHKLVNRAKMSFFFVKFCRNRVRSLSSEVPATDPRNWPKHVSNTIVLLRTGLGQLKDIVMVVKRPRGRFPQIF